MPRRTLDSCTKVLEYLKQRGISSCTPEMLKLTIEQQVGADPRIFERYIKHLIDWKIIEPSISKPGEWLLNFDRLYELNI